MSKIGNKLITIPDSATVIQENDMIKVSGPKGSYSMPVSLGISVAIEGKEIRVKRSTEQKSVKALHGLTQALLQNAITGVTDGYEKKLELVGVGYRAAVTGDELTLTVGYSHPVKIKAPEGLSFAVAGNVITISGNDKQVVGLIAQKIRAVRPPEPYKGKGIKYQGEKIRRKAGKAAKTAGGAK